MSVIISAKNIPPKMMWDTCHEFFKQSSKNYSNDLDNFAVNPLGMLLLQGGPEYFANYLRSSNGMEELDRHSPAWSGIDFVEGKPSGIVTVSPDRELNLGKNRGIVGTLVDVVSLNDNPESAKTLLDEGLDVAELYFPDQVALTILGISKQKEKQIKLSENGDNQKDSVPLDDGLVVSRFCEVVFVGGIKRRIIEKPMRIRRRAVVLSNKPVSI